MELDERVAYFWTLHFPFRVTPAVEREATIKGLGSFLPHSVFFRGLMWETPSWER